jgi:hypothetical protein
VRRTLLSAVLAAIVFITAAPAAGAATLRGRILAQPQVHGTRATVPVLLDAASMRALGARSAQALVTVPAASGFRTATTGRSAPDRTGLGDLVSARVGGLRGRAARAPYLRIERRSSAPSFGDLEARLAASSAGAQQALTEVRRIALAEQSGPQEQTAPSQLRMYLLGVRYQLNLLIDELRSQATGISAVVADVRGSAPASADVLLDRLTKTGAAARWAARTLEDGVAGLDEFINSIGGLGPTSLPVGTTTTIGQVVQTVLGVLDGLGAATLPAAPPLPAGMPGAAPPALP